MKRIKDRDNYEENLHFLMESNKESGLKANGNLLIVFLCGKRTMSFP